MFEVHRGRVDELFGEDFFRDFFGLPRARRFAEKPHLSREIESPPQFETSTRKIELPKRGKPKVVIDSITCAEDFKDLFEQMFGGKVRVETFPGKSEPPRQLKEIMEEPEEEKVPPSIFDMLKSGKEFKDIVAPQPKHTEIYNQAFGLDENGRPDPKYDVEDYDSEIEDEDEGLDDGDAYEDDEPPYIHEPDVVYAEDEEEDEQEDFPKKDPNVFIANRLTFLIQTKLPIIFDTSIIETGTTAKVNYMSIAVNTDKTYPKVETENDLAFIMREFNGSEEIQGEINEFLKDTEYDGIWAFPSTIVRNDVKIPAIRFVIYPKRKYYNFGPAFLNHNK